VYIAAVYIVIQFDMMYVEFLTFDPDIDFEQQVLSSSFNFVCVVVDR